MHLLKSSLLFFLSTFLLSCKKDKTDLVWTELDVPMDVNLDKIVFDDSGNGYLVGGLDWTLGVVAKSDDAGESWSFDSISQKRLYNIAISDEKGAIAVGVDGYLFYESEEEWIYERMPYWIVNRSIAARGDKLLLGSGAAFANGIVHTYSLDDFEIENIYELHFEINDVAFSDERTLHALGYGVILRSVDGGMTWERADVSEDFFQAIQFVDERIGYVIGRTGTILKTEDSGASWAYLRNGNRTFVSDQAFRDMHFLNADEGYICGEDGLLWYTRDGAESWTIADNLPKRSFNGMAIYENNGFLVGEESTFVKFELPE